MKTFRVCVVCILLKQDDTSFMSAEGLASTGIPEGIQLLILLNF